MHRYCLFLLAILFMTGCAVEKAPPGFDTAQPLVVFKVNSISCEGCCNTIKEELALLPGVTKVDADPESKLVHVQVADSKFDSKIVLDRLKTIQYEGAEVVRDVKN